jgi:hypothetical protein
MDKQTTTTASTTTDKETKDRKEHNIHILDLGSKKRGAIRDLENGTGRLMNDVDRVIDDLPQDKGNHIIVVIVKKKRRRGRGKSSMSFSPLNPLSLLRC